MPGMNKFPLVLFVLILSGCATTEKLKLTQPSEKFSPSGNNKAAQEALQLQGHPYVPGGKSPNEGFDCSGLVFYVYKKQGLNLPRDTWSLANQLPSVQLNQRQPGDLVFFNINTKPLSHVGIYVGHDKFVHAPSSHTGKVMVSDLNQPYWRERFTAVRRPSNSPLSLNDTANQICLLN
jgi:cell wall-associated NlpC family hydrolase